MPNPDPEHHEAGVKPSAGAMRIAEYWKVLTTEQMHQAIDAEVEPLIRALENLSNDRAVISIADGELIEAARAALAAWRGDA